MRNNSPINVFFAPHLRGPASFKIDMWRELAGAGILFLTACFISGTHFFLSAVVLLAALVLIEFLFWTAGIQPQLKADSFLFQQGLLLALILPGALDLPILALGGAVLAVFYRLSGGRTGYFAAPVCLVWIFLHLLAPAAASYSFVLSGLPVISGGSLFLIWLAIRFPRTRLEAERFGILFLCAGILKTFHANIDWITALLISAIASDIVWEPGLAPFSVSGRRAHVFLMLVCFAVFLVCLPWIEALVLTGLIAGFLAAWIEERALSRRRA